MTYDRAGYEPAPAPFPVGVEVQYTGPDTGSSVMGLMQGTVGLVVATVCGVRGRPAGTMGPNDPGFETIHGRSEVAYLWAGPTMVAAQAGRGADHSADDFCNLEPAGVSPEVVAERLAAYEAERWLQPTVTGGERAEPEADR